MYQKNFRQNRKRLQKIDKFNALISDERKIINDMNRENNNSTFIEQISSEQSIYCRRHN